MDSIIKKIMKQFFHKKTKFIYTNSRGFFMLYAILFSSIMLIIGMGIIDVVLRQVAFSGVGKESSRAFYAADAGMECALYGDIVKDAFATGTINHLVCNGNDVTVQGKDGPLPTAYDIPEFSFNFWIDKADPADRSCAYVTLVRTFDGNGDVSTTTVSSLGYNSECPNVGNPTRYPLVERGVRGSY